MYNMPPFLESSIDWDNIPEKEDWVFSRSSKKTGVLNKIFRKSNNPTIFGKICKVRLGHVVYDVFEFDDLERMHAPYATAVTASGFLWKVESPISMSIRDLMINKSIPDDYLWCAKLKILVINEDVCWRRSEDGELFGHCAQCELDPLTGPGEYGWDNIVNSLQEYIKDR